MFLKKGSKGPDVKKLQEGFQYLGQQCTLSNDGDFGPSTKATVEKFQHDHGLYDDGVVGNGTAKVFDAELKACDDKKALQYLLLETYTSVNIPQSVSPIQMEWKTCKADIAPGRDGYDHLQLREDVANAYIDLYNAVHRLGGILTTAGGKRSLTTTSNASRSKTSFHYTGRAFDIALPTGMQNVEEDSYVIVASENQYWGVWCRSNLLMDELSPIANAVGVQTTDRLTGTQMSKGLIDEKNTKGVFFSFSDLAKLFGFEKIRARRSFYSHGIYTSAEWWHFQYEAGLAKGYSEFGRELLKVYDLAQAEEFVYWNKVKDFKYGKHWG